MSTHLALATVSFVAVMCVDLMKNEERNLSHTVLHPLSWMQSMIQLVKNVEEKVSCILVCQRRFIRVAMSICVDAAFTSTLLHLLFVDKDPDQSPSSIFVLILLLTLGICTICYNNHAITSQLENSYCTVSQYVVISVMCYVMLCFIVKIQYIFCMHVCRR